MGTCALGVQHQLVGDPRKERAVHVRIVVADQSEARFYDTDHFDSELKLVGRLTDRKVRLRRLHRQTSDHPCH